MERIRSFLTSKNRKIEIPDSRQFGIGCRHCLLVETDGFEPSTPCMSSMYSNQLSYASTIRLGYYITVHIKLQVFFENYLKNCDRIRSQF